MDEDDIDGRAQDGATDQVNILNLNSASITGRWIKLFPDEFSIKIKVDRLF